MHLRRRLMKQYNKYYCSINYSYKRTYFLIFTFSFLRFRMQMLIQYSIQITLRSEENISHFHIFLQYFFHQYILRESSPKLLPEMYYKIYFYYKKIVSTAKLVIHVLKVFGINKVKLF